MAGIFIGSILARNGTKSDDLFSNQKSENSETGWFFGTSDRSMMR
tara:strand:+ start:3661 stop:3795 length:135 start_codon:yes stop_codon:yes gene_type:complete